MTETTLHTRPDRGFTMVELMVTVGIFTIISALLLANYPSFSSRIVLENVAHEIGLSVRQAQSYGLNVRVNIGTGQAIFPPYGVHFSFSGVSQDDPTDEKKFMLFADLLPDVNNPTSNNKRYDGASGCDVSGGECVELFTIQSSEKIVALCGNLKSSGATLENWQSVPGADCSLTALDIVFTRPDPDATITGESVVAGEAVSFSDAEIVVASPRGDKKTVVVWQTGQIAVE